jgi:hypothetical protein
MQSRVRRPGSENVIELPLRVGGVPAFSWLDDDRTTNWRN